MAKLARIIETQTAPDEFGAPDGELSEALAVPMPPEFKDSKGLNIHDTMETNPTVAFDDVGDYIMGRYSGFRSLMIDGRNQKLYDLKRNDGVVSVWGSTVLDLRMEAAIKKGLGMGAGLCIQYLGEVDTGKGNPAKNFRVIWK